MHNNEWFEYLQTRLKAVESSIRFILSSFAIILGILIAQLFVVLDEDIIPYFSERETIESHDFIRPVSLIILIGFLIFIALKIFKTMNTRKREIKKIIRKRLINKNQKLSDEWNNIEKFDDYNDIWHFLFGKKDCD